MSNFFDHVSRDLDRLAQEKQKREGSLTALSDERFNHKYQLACEDIAYDGYCLGANANKVFLNASGSLEEIEADWNNFMEHIETLQALHAEFLRRLKAENNQQ